MPFTYILECSDKTLYVGSTYNLEKRIWEHQNGVGAAYTKVRRPIKLLYSEEYETITEAFGREKQIQNWSRKKRLALISNDFNKLQELANPRKRGE
jgi:putative endonuclease